jgi:hypothetical protein
MYPLKSTGMWYILVSMDAGGKLYKHRYAAELFGVPIQDTKLRF